MTRQELIQLAQDMRTRAYSPYSGFAVGAALECADGRVFTGCNIENASYSLTLCAERTAAVKAVSEGCTHFVRIAVAGSSSDCCTPCGACRQFLAEFCDDDMEVICINKDGIFEAYSLHELLPHAFR